MTGFLHPWLGELIDNSAKEWEGPLGSWEAQGAGFVQVLRNTLVPPQPSQRQAEGAYEAVQEALGLDTGFIVLRVGDSRNALSAVVPAPVLQLMHLGRGKPRHLALAGMLLRVELTVKMDVAGTLPEASGVHPAAPCYLLIRSLRVFSRKCGVIGTCRPLGLPSLLRALKEKEQRAADQRQKEQEEQKKQAEQKRQEEQEEQKRQEEQEEQEEQRRNDQQRQLQETRQQQDGDAVQQKSATMPSKGDEACRVMDVWECVVPTEQLQLEPFLGVRLAESSSSQSSVESCFQLEDISSTASSPKAAEASQSSSVGSGPTYPPLSMASSSTASQEADEPNSSAVVVQQSRDSLELNGSKEGNDGVPCAMDFNSLNESDLSEQELQAVRRNRFMSQGADAVAVGSPPRLLQLSPIKEGADSPIFQRPPGKPVAPSGPDPSRDVSMELVSDLYADLATQDSQGVGEDHDDEAASEDAVLDESLEEESSLLAGLEDLEESDDADLSALFAVSGATPGALSQQEEEEEGEHSSQQEEEEEGEHSQSVAAAVAAHAPAQSTVSLAQIDVMQKDLLTTMSLLAQGNQQIEEATIELEQEQVNVAKEKQKNERLRVENLQLAEELALAKKELTATEKELAEASQLVQEQQKDLAKSALLIQELHKRLKQTRESPRPEHSEIVEDATTLRLNRQLPAELLARKKRQRQQEAEPASKEARSDSAQRSPGSPARTGAARAKAIAARAEMVALGASPSTAVLTSNEAAAAVVSAPSRASSAKNRQPRRPKPSATTLARAGAQLHRPSPGPSPKRPSPQQPSSSVANAQRSSTPALNIIAAKPRPPSAPAASKRTPTAASPSSRTEPRPPSAGAARTQEAGRMAGMKRKSPASSPAPAPAPAPAKKAKLSSAKAKRMALFSQKYLVKK